MYSNGVQCLLHKCCNFCYCEFNSNLILDSLKSLYIQILQHGKEKKKNLKQTRFQATFKGIGPE